MKEKRQVKFYADNSAKGIKNKLHTYNVNNEQDAQRALIRFRRIGYQIRAAWYLVAGQSSRIV